MTKGGSPSMLHETLADSVPFCFSLSVCSILGSMLVNAGFVFLSFQCGMNFSVQETRERAALLKRLPYPGHVLLFLNIVWEIAAKRSAWRQLELALLLTCAAIFFI